MNGGVHSRLTFRNFLYGSRSFVRKISILRNYQTECIVSILDALAKGKRPGVSLPTGSGKTLVMCHLVDKYKHDIGKDAKTLIIVNRREIASQVHATFGKQFPSIRVVLELGSSRYKEQEECDVCIASIASLSRIERLSAFDPQHFGLIVIDEAHHAAAMTYERVLKHFGLLQRNSHIRLVGFSATFFRQDKKALDTVFDEVIYHKPPSDMMNQGYLVRAKLTHARCFSSAKLPKIEQKIGQKLLAPSNPLKTADGIKLLYGLWNSSAGTYKSTMIFGIDLSHSAEIVRVFRENGVDARAVNSNMTNAARKEIIEAFKNQEFPVIVNCGLLTEGTDIPVTDQIILARGTSSVGLAMQMIGRGLRPAPGKSHCHIISFPELNNLNGDLEPALNGITFVQPESRSSMKGKEARKKPRSIANNTDLKIDEIDIETGYDLSDLFQANYSPKHPRYSSLNWVQHNGKYYLFGPPGRRTYFYVQPSSKEAKDIWEFGIRIYVKGRLVTKFKMSQNSLSGATALGDRMALNYWGFTALRMLRRKASWRIAPASAAQIKVIGVENIKQLPSISRGVAHNVIGLMSAGYRAKPKLILEQMRQLNSA